MAPRTARGPSRSRSSLEARAQGRLFARVNRELYKRNAELAIRNKTLALLRKLDEISLSALEMEDMARTITDTIGAELGYELVSLAVVDTRANLLRWFALSSPVPTMSPRLRTLLLPSVTLPVRGTLASQQVLRGRSPRLATSLRAVFPTAVGDALAGGRRGSPQLRSTLIYPLRLGRAPLGLLTISAGRDLTALTRFERESLVGIMGTVTLALTKARVTRELREAAARLRVANEKLGEVDKAKDEFMSIVSHQLYTPLTSLRGYLSMMRDGDFGPVPEKQRPVVDILRQSSDRLVNLIRNLLDVSRIESGRLELQLESVDLVPLVRGLVAELQPNAERKNLRLRVEEPRGAVRVVADKDRLRQVMLNTVDNAIKYTEKGSVDVAVERRGNNVFFRVRDTGRGIARDALERLFGKFTRLDHGGRRPEGLGLGLYLARQIVREIHGDIWAESPGEGRGSTFVVQLPAEGTSAALRAGTTLTVGIKAAGVGEKAA